LQAAALSGARTGRDHASLSRRARTTDAASMLDVVGFDAAAPALIADFVRA
jgi:hypothetical protein